MKGFKKHIALFYLILFIGVKFVDLHTYAHNDYESYEDCDLCEYVENGHNTYFLVDEVCDFEQLKQHAFNQQLPNGYAYTFEKSYVNNALFSRPPPMI
ncbi:conserved protein of unknown function [Tenacibaculum sp. 190130A14a]|uniref:Uncharacterized protein n=1 Tax=Tenacibaculum polynesiense TaxID=3137857 RepID=A0ABP1ES10_9FLAO